MKYKIWFIDGLTAKTADDLTAALNTLAQQGWRVVFAMPTYLVLKK